MASACQGPSAGKKVIAREVSLAAKPNPSSILSWTCEKA
jgi:hypothetical protein